MGRKFKTGLTWLHPEWRSNVSERQPKQMMGHDKGARLEPPVQPGRAVYARNFRRRTTWVPTTLTATPSDCITDVTLPDEHLRPDLSQAVAPLESAEQAVLPAEAVPSRTALSRTTPPVLPRPTIDVSAHMPEAVESRQKNHPPSSHRLPPESTITTKKWLKKKTRASLYAMSKFVVFSCFLGR